MASSSMSIRPAILQDAPALAELVNFAGEGLPLYLWAKMAKEGEDAWSVGRARASREEGSFSYRNATIVEADGSAAACLIGYPLADEPEAIDEASMPPMFLPMQQLENLAPGTWYVNVLASYPQWRGQGFGTALLQHAEKFAAAGAKRGMSVIVADDNAGARRLYERMGYRLVAERPMVKESWQSAGSAWQLLVKGM